MSGIATPEFEINDDSALHRAACRVHLAEPGERMQQSSVHVGLASISNDNTAFAFSVESATLDRDPATDQLVLTAELNVKGARSYLHRFSYQVVLVEQVVATEITGTLNWQRGVFTQSPPDLATVQDAFSVVVHDGGSDAGPVIVLGTITSVTPASTIAGPSFQAAYEISGAPLDRLITVDCNVQELPSSLVMRPTTPGINTFTLTAAQPTRTGVDFRVGRRERGLICPRRQRQPRRYRDFGDGGRLDLRLSGPTDPRRRPGAAQHAGHLHHARRRARLFQPGKRP